jgi:hypothetical protein
MQTLLGFVVDHLPVINQEICAEERDLASNAGR